MNPIEEGTELKLDFAKLARAAKASTGVLPVAIQHADTGDDQHEHRRATAECADERVGDHASTARPFSANRPRGRFWMNRMMATSTRILPSTAPA